MGVHAQAKEGVNRLAHTITLCSHSSQGGHVVQEVGSGTYSSLALRSLRRGYRVPFRFGGRVGIDCCCTTFLHYLGNDFTNDCGITCDLSPLVYQGSSSSVSSYYAEVPSLIGDEPDVGAGGRVKSGYMGGEVGDEGREGLERGAEDGLREGGGRGWCGRVW